MSAEGRPIATWAIPAAVLAILLALLASDAGTVATRLRGGAKVALVSEAGTPLVSDPGYRIVAAAIAAGARVVPVPGPSAVLAALVGAGLPTDRFLFLGFPPRKPGARRRLFESVRALPFTLVLYESPLRAGETLADLAAVLGGPRAACLARELTKPYEEFVRGTLTDLAARYEKDRPLGEVTLVVAGGARAPAMDPPAAAAEVAAREAAGTPRKEAIAAVAAESGLRKRDVYDAVVAARRSPSH